MDYDEQAILGRVSLLPHPAKTAFAACCAQRLLPLFARYTQRTSKGDAASLTTVLDDVWSSLERATPGLASGQALAEEMVPDNDVDDWVFEMTYGQNAAAAIAYAAAVALTGDNQECAWAAYQVYEAADSAAQHLLSDADESTPQYNAALLAHPLVQTAISGIYDDLARVENESGKPQNWLALKHTAEHEGAAWSHAMP